MTTIIRSTDSAAVSASAILTGNAGSLIAVLDYALVTVLGWGKAFTGTNKASYRAAAGARHYLDVDDSAPDATALGRNARVRGYETMSAVGTGTGAFPTTTQVTNCVGLIKSTATGTTARPWIIIGDDRTFWMFSEAGGTDPPNLVSHSWTDGFHFGEYVSVLSGDSYRTVLQFASVTTTAVAATLNAFTHQAVTSTTAANTAIPRLYTGVGTGAWAAALGDFFSYANLTMSGGSIAYPNIVDGGLYANLVTLFERGSGTTPSAVTSGNGLRGYVRGLYGVPYSTTGYNDQDTYSGVSGFAGKTLIGLKMSGHGMYVFDTGTWPYTT